MGIVIALVLIFVVVTLYSCVVLGKKRDIQEREYWERKDKK